MATTRSVGAVRRTGGPAGRSGASTPEIPPARWAGVALVIAALLATIVLAIVSPSDEVPTQAAAGVAAATHRPAASVAPGGDTRVPTTQPTIRAPRDGSKGREWDIPVTVEVPQEPLASRNLSLVILIDGEEVKRLERPGRGKPVTVGSVRLKPGRNELTAALAGPGGLGPLSAPVIVHQDSSAPELRITSPEGGTVTTDGQVDLAIASEPGAALVIRNQATGRESSETVGPSGTANVTVRLGMGKNRIVVTSTDEASMQQDQSILVIREDGRPRVRLTVTPKQVSRGALPRQVNVVVVVENARGDPVPDAIVSFNLAGPGWVTQDSEGITNANGRSVWRPEIEASASREPLTVTVDVVANGESRGASRDIRVG